MHLEPGLHSWYLRQPKTSTYQTEVRVLRFGRLLVHGDLPLVIFGGYSGGVKGILEWAAYSSLDYIASKVLTKPTHEFDTDIAKGDLKDMLEEAKKPDYDGAWAEFLENELIPGMEHDCTEFHLQQLTEFANDYEEYVNVGQVVSSDIIWAQMVLRRLIDLDKDKDYDLFGDRA